MSNQVKEDVEIKTMLLFQAGDESAFDRLVSQYKHPVKAVAYRFLQQEQDAEDAAQETFIRIYQVRKCYQPGRRFSSWLYTILNRVCLKKIRQHKRHRTISSDQPLGKQGEGVTWYLAGKQTLSATEQVLSDEKQMMVKKVVAELKPDERMAMILDQWEGMGLADIAEILQKNVLTIKSLLFRARAKCRIKLQAYINERSEGKAGHHGM